MFRFNPNYRTQPCLKSEIYVITLRDEIAGPSIRIIKETVSIVFTTRVPAAVQYG
jgi:hypothetical protein